MEKIKILILGSTGMLGHQVYYQLKKKNLFEVHDVSFRVPLTENSILLDVLKKENLIALIKKIRPGYIINCIGVLIGGSNESSANAIYVNSYLPHLLNDVALNLNSKLIHISTDCVFSGQRGKYVENDIKDGQDTYALTKSLGEIINNQSLTLRTSIIGPELKKNGEGLFHWFLNQTGTVKGYTNAYWSGVTTLELSKIILCCIEQGLVGLYHVTNGIPISKYKLLVLFNELFANSKIQIIKSNSKVVDKSLLDTRKELKCEIPTYEAMLLELKKFMVDNYSFYTHYNIPR